MKKVASAVMAICLAGMVGPRALAENWTWCAEGGNWADQDNWNKGGAGCGGLGYPNSSSDQVTISGFDSVVTVNVVLITIGSLTLTSSAELKVPFTGGYRHVLKIGDEDGLTLEGTNSQLILEGGHVELSGGGDVTIDGTNESVVLFQTIADGRFIFTGAKAYAIVRTDRLGDPPDNFFDAFIADGVHGFIDGGSAAPDDEVVMLYEHGVKGDITITAHFVNAGIVSVDEADKNVTLCGRPKMGSGTWSVNHNSAKIVGDAIVVGDSCSLVEISAGRVDVNSFWFSAGQLLMDEDATSPTKLSAAAGKIMQFGRRAYCVCVPPEA